MPGELRRLLALDEWDWERCIQEWNQWLRARHRKQLSRYHASDCSNKKNEFKRWSSNERNELTADLIKILQKYLLHTLAYAIDMKKFYKVFPSFRKKAKREVLKLIYGMMTKFLVYTLGDEILAGIPAALVSLVHDGCSYDSAMSSAFNQCLTDPTFKHKQIFSTLCSRKSCECLPLQSADFLSYINFKESHSLLSGRKRSIPLVKLIEGNQFGGGIKFLGEDALVSLKAWLKRNRKNEKTKKSVKRLGSSKSDIGGVKSR